MPTKRLPETPNLDHLKHQARDLLAGCAAADPASCQRLREFHPRFAEASDAVIRNEALGHSDGLFAIAREYGFASWPRLKAHVDAASKAPVPRSFRDRIDDPVLRDAVDAVDDGDLTALSGLLTRWSDLAQRRARFDGENYFRSPSLLAFIAENPVRNDALPPNIVEVARLLLDHGGWRAEDLDETLELLASGRVVREAGVQVALIDLLVDHGANPSRALDAATGHGEWAAVTALRRLGAPPRLAVAAALGDETDAARLLPAADAIERHRALALAAQFGRDGVLRLLLAAGEDPNRYNPPGTHSHSTPLHQAALAGHAGAVRLLLAYGARRDLKDTLWNGTALDWAKHGGHEGIVGLGDAGR